MGGGGGGILLGDSDAHELVVAVKCLWLVESLVRQARVDGLDLGDVEQLGGGLVGADGGEGDDGGAKLRFRVWGSGSVSGWG